MNRVKVMSKPRQLRGPDQSLRRVPALQSQSIPVVFSQHRQETQSGPQEPGLLLLSSTEINNNPAVTPSNKPKHTCNLCVRKVEYDDESSYFKHLKLHYEELFKCKECELGFERWKDVLRHCWKQHGTRPTQADGAVVRPGQADRLLAARCRLAGCRRHFVAVTEAEVAEHFYSLHWSSRHKVAGRLEWTCRLCNNGGRLKHVHCLFVTTDCGSRRFHSREEALRHVELHQAGLVRWPDIAAQS